MIQVNRIYLIFNRLVTKKFLVDTSEKRMKTIWEQMLIAPALIVYSLRIKNEKQNVPHTGILLHKAPSAS